MGQKWIGVSRVSCIYDFRASKRRKLWPSLFSLQFDDVCSGPPVPTNSSHEVRLIFFFFVFPSTCTKFHFWTMFTVGTRRRFGTAKGMLRVSRSGQKPSVRAGSHRRRASPAPGGRSDSEIRRHSLVTVFPDHFRFGHWDRWYNISRWVIRTKFKQSSCLADVDVA